MTQLVLLVEPNFPFPSKSKNKAGHVHKNFIPIGLLKLAALHKAKGDKVQLVRGKKSKEEINFVPDKILVTSLFTYWSDYVWDSIAHYRGLFPRSEIILGGIYATLHQGTKKFDGLAKEHKVGVSKGVHPEAEKYLPDYSLLPSVDYHATHMMRGCIRRCSFCGTWKIEPERISKSKEEVISELEKVGMNRVIFYDNNLLANPHIKDILNAFQDLRINKRPVIFESQSGFDGRLMEKDPELAQLLRKARFQSVRIAWDNGLEDRDSIARQINLLVDSGYPPKDITVFMIYNFELPYEKMIKKIENCRKWGVQICDCRNRPLDLDYDNYSPGKRNGQPEGSFYIHTKSGWTDKKIREFRKRVRQHNIEIRYAKDKGLKYDKAMEKWSAIHHTFKFFSLGRPPQMEEINRSPTFQKRLKSLNRVKSYYYQNRLEPLNLSILGKSELDEKLSQIIDEISKKREKKK